MNLFPKTWKWVRIPGTRWKATTANVTKKIADEWLANHNYINRPMTKSAVSAYAREMKAGRWGPLAGSPIVFANDNGTPVLLDGQQRTQSISITGMAQKCFIIADENIDNYCKYDQNKPRTARDLLLHVRREDTASNARSIAKTMSTILRQMVIQTRPRQVNGRILNSHMVEINKQFGKAAEKIAKLCPTIKRPITAPVLGALSRALQRRAPIRDVARFIQIMKTNRPITGEPEESNALILARYILSLDTIGGSQMHDDITQKTETAFQAYLNGEVLTSLRRAKENPWPIYL